MENTVTLRMIRLLDLIMKINVILCIIGLIAIKSGFIESLRSKSDAGNISVVEKKDPAAAKL